MSSVPNILDQDQLAQLMGYAHPGDVERKLRDQGITPIYGRRGKFFVTVDMLNAARGVVPEKENGELF